MQILSHKQKLFFINGGDQFNLEPKNTIQEAPDWIRETGTFQHALSARLVVELNVVSPALAPRLNAESGAHADVAGLSASNRPALGKRKAKAA